MSVFPSGCSLLINVSRRLGAVSLASRGIALLLVVGLVAPPSVAQVADSAEVAVEDTTSVDTSSSRVPERLDSDDAPRRVRPPLSYADAERGTPLHTVPPIRQPALDAPTLLQDWPGSFLYDFGTVGWPDGWSPEGMSPQRPTLLFGGIAFDNLVTGAPRYDLLPLEWLEPLRVAPLRYGAPYAVHAQPRPFPAPEPLTLLRYRTRGNGLQSVMALHVQQRRLQLLSRPGIVQIVGGYGGHANDGAYSSSRLRRMRQLYGRLRYAQPRWSVEFSNLHNRRHIGAHAGIVPGASYESIYYPETVTVLHRGAERQTIRNDLVLTARLQLLRRLESPLTATTYWTAQTFRYLHPRAASSARDTLGTRADRNGLQVYQDLRWNGHFLRLRLEGQWDRVSPTAGWRTSSDSHTRLHLAVLDSTRLLGIDVTAEGTLHSADDLPTITGRLDLSRGSEGRRLFASLVYAGQPISWTARHGFGAVATPLDDVPVGTLARLRVGGAFQFGAFDATLTLFGHRLTQAVDYVRPDIGVTDTIRAAIIDEGMTRLGASLRLGVRREALRGFYGWGEVTTYYYPGVDRTPSPSNTTEDPQLAERLAASTPELAARGRLGMRYELFQADLDLDLYLLGRAWSPFRSRVFHASTALFALPPVGARTFGPSGTLDLFVEAGIRAATVFVSYENILAGRVYHGTLLVPDYPLPGRRLRFGVYWPITG